jgi:hypothetical protein
MVWSNTVTQYSVFGCNIHANSYDCVSVTQCVRKVAVHLQKVFKVMSTSVYTGLNPFNFCRSAFGSRCALIKGVANDVHGPTMSRLDIAT